MVLCPLSFRSVPTWPTCRLCVSDALLAWAAVGLTCALGGRVPWGQETGKRVGKLVREFLLSMTSFLKSTRLFEPKWRVARLVQ